MKSENYEIRKIKNRYQVLEKHEFPFNCHCVKFQTNMRISGISSYKSFFISREFSVHVKKIQRNKKFSKNKKSIKKKFFSDKDTKSLCVLITLNFSKSIIDFADLRF